MREESADKPRIAEARFHPQTRQLFISLDNGAIVALLALLIEGLAEAEADAAGEIEIVDDGHVLFWPLLDLHVAYLSILTEILGARGHIARLVGSPAQRAQEKAERAAEAGRIGRLKRPRR